MALTPEQELLQAIAAQAPNRVVHAALLVGSYGESNWNPEAVSPGAYGAFQFTPPGNYGPGSEVGASPAAQVAAILAEYVEVASRVPTHLTGAAQAQWIALGAERPFNYEQDQATIEATNQPTTYGANTSYTVQNWATIEALLAEVNVKSVLVPVTVAANGQGQTVIPYATSQIAAVSLMQGEEDFPTVTSASYWKTPNPNETAIIVKGGPAGSDTTTTVTVNVAVYTS